MSNKKLIVEISCAAAILIASSICVYFCGKIFTPNQVTQKQEQTSNVKKQVKKTAEPVKAVQEKEKIKTNLYSNSPYDIPLISIAEISTLDKKIQNIVEKVFEDAQGFYLLNLSKDKDKLFIIPQNPTNPNDNFERHNLEFIEISMRDEDYGNITTHSIGFGGEDGETINAIANPNTATDLWKTDNSMETPRPLTHIKYNYDKKVEYTEVWNYEDNNPVKYAKRNADDKLISVKRENSDKEHYTVEHIFYDADGHIEISLSVTYIGPNISNIIFFSAKDGFNSLTITTEYTDGLKTSEKIYNGEYQHIYTSVATYLNNKRESITLKDNTDKELLTIFAE